MRRLTFALIATTLLLISLIPAGAQGTPDVLERLRRFHEEAWRHGGVCRHAAVGVKKLSEKLGLKCSLPWWKAKPEFTHVVPILTIGDKHYAIETFKVNGSYEAHVIKVPEVFNDCEDARRYTGIPCLEFNGELYGTRLWRAAESEFTAGQWLSKKPTRQAVR